MNRDERGGVAVLALVVMVLAGLILLGLARAGGAAGRSARAGTAADAAALAAALTLGRGGDSLSAGLAAAQTARDNGAVLDRCDCHGDHAEVVVRIDDATGRARAEVDRGCVLTGDPCGGTGSG